MHWENTCSDDALDQGTNNVPGFRRGISKPPGGQLIGSLASVRGMGPHGGLQAGAVYDERSTVQGRAVKKILDFLPGGA